MKQLEVKDALPEGFKLHWYKIQGVLGRGGFGITYLARDTNLDVDVAIKEYFPMEYASREGNTQSLEATSADKNDVYSWGLEKFVIEARILAKFSHKNIVRVSSVFDQNNTAYMVMDMEVGQSLADVIAANTKYTEAQLTSMLVGLMDGLAFVHEKGFIHRDIKPANIILRPDGEPVLLDFGSARGAVKQTTKLTSLVSFGYTPFEQYHASSDKQGSWTDVYALAGTFHHLIMGSKPAEAMARATEIMNGKPDPQLSLTECRALGLSDRFLSAIDAGLSFSAEDRPQTMGEWKAMLLGEAPIPQRPEVQAPQQTSADTVLMSPTGFDSHTHHREPLDQPKASKALPIAAAGTVLLAALGGGAWFMLQNNSVSPEPTPPVVQKLPEPEKPKVDLAELERLKAELEQAKQQADVIAEERAEELAALKAEREEREKEKRLELERQEAARLAEEARKKADAEKRRVEQERKRVIAQKKAELSREAQRLVDDFIAAFERKDAEYIINTHSVATEKETFARQLLGAYQSFSLSNQPFNIDLDQRQVLTTVTINSVRTSNGSIVKPSANWRDIPLVIKPKNNQLTLFWE